VSEQNPQMIENGEVTNRVGFIRRLYVWTMAKARGPHAVKMLFVVSFAESSFFPIPPDLMLLPMCLANRARAFFLAAWCTLASVLGGMFGYLIGALLFETIGQWLISVYGYGDSIEAFRALYADWGPWTILVGGLTPVPYKLITIASGVAGYDIFLFIALSAFTRGTRFGLEAALVYLFGEPVREFIEKRLEIVFSAAVFLVIAGVVAVRYVF
jgi:membrane protein YqaA with SNARE-associated domain